MRKRKLEVGIIAWLTAGVFVMQSSITFAACIEADQRANMSNRPIVKETANHLPLINITSPTAGGVSRNMYSSRGRSYCFGCVAPQKVWLLSHQKALLRQLCFCLSRHQSLLRSCISLLKIELQWRTMLLIADSISCGLTRTHLER